MNGLEKKRYANIFLEVWIEANSCLLKKLHHNIDLMTCASLNMELTALYSYHSTRDGRELPQGIISHQHDYTFDSVALIKTVSFRIS